MLIFIARNFTVSNKFKVSENVNILFDFLINMVDFVWNI